MKKCIKSVTSIEPRLLKSVKVLTSEERQKSIEEEEGKKWFNNSFWFPPGMEAKINLHFLSWKQNSASFSGLQLSQKQKMRPYL